MDDLFNSGTSYPASYPAGYDPYQAISSDTGMMGGWSEWFQDASGAVLKAALAGYQYKQIASAGGVPAVTQGGQVYTEGQRVPYVNTGGQGMGINSNMLMLLMAGLAAVIILK